jgi:DNA-binding NarL/FixJ family response regulator
MPITVLLADDQAQVRRSLAEWLFEQADIVHVAQVENGAQALAVCRQLRFDVAVLDVAMPVMNGVQALLALHRELPRLPIIMLSLTSDAAAVRHCLKAGALGYVAKPSAAEELLAAIRAVVAGQTYLCRLVQAALKQAGQVKRG